MAGQVIAACSSVLASNPGEATPYSNRGDAYSSQGEFMGDRRSGD
jgi:hypothetical protein